MATHAEVKLVVSIAGTEVISRSVTITIPPKGVEFSDASLELLLRQSAARVLSGISIGDPKLIRETLERLAND